MCVFPEILIQTVDRILVTPMTADSGYLLECGLGFSELGFCVCVFFKRNFEDLF